MNGENDNDNNDKKNNKKTAGNDTSKPMTHIAWALQHRRVKRTIWTIPLEVGVGRIEPDGTPHVFLDREPKSGYGGYLAEIILLPRGVAPDARQSDEDVNGDVAGESKSGE
jgi:hypothetical protein